MAFSLKDRIEILGCIADYLSSEDVRWLEVRQRAELSNPWFIQPFISYAIDHIVRSYLQSATLQQLAKHYQIPDAAQKGTKTLGIVNAGNIPLVGFQDFLSAFLLGVPCQIKLSSKDTVLFTDIHKYIEGIYPEFGEYVQIVDRLSDCDAYIATGGDSSSTYFRKYFGNKAHIIRSHRNSVAILRGDESADQLAGLSRDIHLYFGLGCRSVSHIFVPESYDFEPLLASFSEFDFFQQHSKYMNNYDYQLALDIVNNTSYMTDGSTLLHQNAAYASPISVLHYSHYSDAQVLRSSLDTSSIQCIVSAADVPFGESQNPKVTDFADGVDSFQFCRDLID